MRGVRETHPAREGSTAMSQCPECLHDTRGEDHRRICEEPDKLRAELEALRKDHDVRGEKIAALLEALAWCVRSLKEIGQSKGLVADHGDAVDHALTLLRPWAEALGPGVTERIAIAFDKGYQMGRRHEREDPSPVTPTTTHHPWCSYFTRPRAGCRLCERLWVQYPLTPGQTVDALLKTHFPDTVKRGNP